MTEFYVDQLGNYIGAFDGGAKPANAVHLTKVDIPPATASDIWDGKQWIPMLARPADPDLFPNLRRVQDLAAILVAKGILKPEDLG